ncbi:MAG: TolC family protein [Marinilabiliaceae bacterium]|nr:TolC family protein [Marinilabiliaceae bacterium]
MTNFRFYITALKLMVAPLMASPVEPDSMLVQLPPVNILIEAAMAHSPLLQAKQKQVDIDQQEVTIRKRQWMDYLFVEGTANYGVYDQVLLQDHSSENSSYNTGSLNRGEQSRYYGGVGIKLPFSSLTNRNRELQKRSLIRERSELEMKEVQLQLKHMIIDAYYHLQYLDESMRTFYQIYQTLKIGYLKAEKDLLNGRTDLNEFALLASTVGKAKDDYQKAKHNFYSHYHKLKDLTGIEF